MPPTRCSTPPNLDKDQLPYEHKSTVVGRRRWLWPAVLGRSLVVGVGTVVTAQSSIDRLMQDFNSRRWAWRRVALTQAARVRAGQMHRELIRLGVDPDTWYQAYEIQRHNTPTSERADPWDHTLIDAHNIALKAIAALLMWPDCGHLLDADPDQVQMWAALGQPAAILLLLACVALHAQETTDA
jgi:hypothetical protein